MVLNGKRKRKPNFLQLTINDYPVEQVNSAKLLCVMLSSDLKWNQQKIFETPLYVAPFKKSKGRYENFNYSLYNVYKTNIGIL